MAVRYGSRMVIDMGFGLGSRSFYAEFNGWVFQFEDKRTRDIMVKGGNKIKAVDADKVSYMGRVEIPRLVTVHPKPKRLGRATK